MTIQDVVAASDHRPPTWGVRIVRWTVWALLTGTIVYMTTIISEGQAKIKEANERLFRIVHGSPIATVMCDEQAKVVEYNKAAQEMLGWSREEIVGKDVNVMIAPSFRKQHGESFRKAVEVLREVAEDWRVTKTGLKGVALTKYGTEVNVVFSTRGIRYGDKIEFLAFVRPEDIPPPKLETGPLELPKKIVP